MVWRLSHLWQWSSARLVSRWIQLLHDNRVSLRSDVITVLKGLLLPTGADQGCGYGRYGEREKCEWDQLDSKGKSSRVREMNAMDNDHTLTDCVAVDCHVKCYSCPIYIHPVVQMSWNLIDDLGCSLKVETCVQLLLIRLLFIYPHGLFHPPFHQTRPPFNPLSPGTHLKLPWTVFALQIQTDQCCGRCNSSLYL